jgi:glutamate/tyrosine decarboxylase-like PLP-dependent enzyme
MDGLEERIHILHASSSALEPSEEQRAALLGAVKKHTDSFIANIDTDRAFKGLHGGQSGLDIDSGTTSIHELLSIYDRELQQKGLNPASGGHLGYIPGGGLYTSALGDMLAAVSDQYAGMYFGGPGAVNMENALIDWTKEVFRYPATSVGNLSSGGSIANLIALTAARDRYGIKNQNVPKSVIYLSEQVHHCVQKAIRIIGLEDSIIRYIPLDETFRMDANVLRSSVERDKQDDLLPFLVIGSAGTTDTGAIDPLDTIADIAEENDLWFHVDAAYGGYFILVESLKEKFTGIERSDSLAVDPHKGLFLPYGTGIVLVKDVDAVMHSQHYTANYMQDARSADTPINPADVSPELTKHFRGPRMWLPLRLHGLEPFKACLEEKILLTHYMREELVKLGFQVGPAPDLSVSFFWYEPESGNADTFNKRLIELIHQDGRVFLSSSVIGGRFVIRIAILAFRTKLHTINAGLEMISDSLDRVKAEFSS